MGKVRVVIPPGRITQLLTSPGAERIITAKTKALVDACNAESSWGGYDSEVETDGTRARGRVWSYARQDGTGKTERAQRMIRNLDAE